jgi:hypothetical protein
MVAVKKTVIGLALIFVTLLGLMLNGSTPIGFGQSGTTASGIISQDTTWSKTNSPYMLTGPVGIPQGVTLTIEPGAAVYLYSYYIMVNGTLHVRGNVSEPVFFNGGWGGPGTVALTFEPSSSNWSQQTGTGCIIENAVLNETNVSVENVSLRINNDTFISSPIQTYGASPQILNSSFSNCGVSMASSIYSPTPASPVIANNTVRNGEISFGGGTTSAFATISNNSIHGGGIGGVGYAYIVDNTISDCVEGLALNTAVVFGGSEPAYPTVMRNLITQNNYGIHINLFARYEVGTLVPLITNNTISQNSVGVYLTESQYGASPTIAYNNFEDNANYNVYLDQSTPNNVNATYNWWGTTDMVLIGNSIHDSKNDFTLGTVTFLPSLTTPNPQALPAPIATPIPAPSVAPTQEPTPIQSAPLTLTPLPSVPEFPSFILVPMLISTMLGGAIIYKKKLSKNKQRHCYE